MQTPVILEVSKDQWSDIYELTGIQKGSVLIVQNIGDTEVLLATADNRPDIDSRAYQKIQPNDFPFKNDGGDMNEWARAASNKGFLSVRVF